MAIELHIYPDPMLVAGAMEAAAVDIEDSDGPMLSSLGHLMASVDRAFMEQGPGWDPWSLSYALSRGHGHGPLLDQDSILIRTAELIGTTQDPANYSIERDRISWNGNAAPDYGEFHLTGTSKMPERNFLVVDEEAESAILDDWARWMDRIVEAVAAFSSAGKFLGFRGAGGRFVPKP